jgi:hypothetical protein
MLAAPMRIRLRVQPIDLAKNSLKIILLTIASADLASRQWRRISVAANRRTRLELIDP